MESFKITLVDYLGRKKLSDLIFMISMCKRHIKHSQM